MSRGKRGGGGKISASQGKRAAAQLSRRIIPAFLRSDRVEKEREREKMVKVDEREEARARKVDKYRLAELLEIKGNRSRPFFSSGLLCEMIEDPT